MRLKRRLSYVLVDSNGNKTQHRSTDAKALTEIARELWPDQHQDDSDGMVPNGWDVEVER